MTVHISQWYAPCPHCGRHIITTGHGGHAYPKQRPLPADPRPTIIRHGVHTITCPGSGQAVDYPPTPVGEATWIALAMHRDECRTAAGLACVCVLAVVA